MGKTKRRLISLICCFLVCLSSLISSASATSAAIGKVDAFDDLEGNSQYVAQQYRDNYYLDIEETGLLDAAADWLNSGVNVLFGLIKTLGGVAVTIFYYSIDFDLVALFSPQMDAIQAGLKSSVFDSFFILAFCGSAWVMMTKLARRDLNGMIIEVGKVVLILIMSAFVVVESSTALSAATQITKSIGTAALMDINQEKMTTSDYAASASGMIWKGLIFDPWVTLEFSGTSPSDEEINQFLTTKPNSDERKQLVKDYMEAHQSEDSTIFSKDLGIGRLGFLFIYLLLFLIKAVVYIALALLQIAYQLMAVFFVILAPVILLMSLLPSFGIELVGNWLKKIFETQVMMLVLTFLTGLVLKFDNLIYSLNGQYGWLVVLVIEAVIFVTALLKYKSILKGISKINSVARQPQMLKYKMMRAGDATVMSQKAVHTGASGAAGVGRGIKSGATWAADKYRNRPQYDEADYQKETSEPVKTKKKKPSTQPPQPPEPPADQPPNPPQEYQQMRKIGFDSNSGDVSTREGPRPTTTGTPGEKTQQSGENTKKKVTRPITTPHPEYSPAYAAAAASVATNKLNTEPDKEKRNQDISRPTSQPTEPAQRQTAQPTKRPIYFSDMKEKSPVAAPAPANRPESVPAASNSQKEQRSETSEAKRPQKKGAEAPKMSQEPITASAPASNTSVPQNRPVTTNKTDHVSETAPPEAKKHTKKDERSLL